MIFVFSLHLVLWLGLDPIPTSGSVPSMWSDGRFYTSPTDVQRHQMHSNYLKWCAVTKWHYLWMQNFYSRRILTNGFGADVCTLFCANDSIIWCNNWNVFKWCHKSVWHNHRKCTNTDAFCMSHNEWWS